MTFKAGIGKKTGGTTVNKRSFAEYLCAKSMAKPKA